jgi:uncharacterized protein (TIGR00369 family)
MIIDRDAQDRKAQGWEPYVSSGFFKGLGPTWRKTVNGQPLFGIEATQDHLNGKGIVHGGLLLTMLDQAISMTAIDACDGALMVTLQLETQFVGAAKAGDFIEGDATITRKTRSLIFLRGELRVGDRILVSGQGIMKLREPAAR